MVRAVEVLRCWESGVEECGFEPACGVVAAPYDVLFGLREVLGDERSFALVDSRRTNASTSEATLLRRGPRATLLSHAGAGAVDRVLLALDAECPMERWSTRSARLEAVRAVATELDSSGSTRAAPVAASTVERWRRRLGEVGADLDVRGLWTLDEEALFPDARAVRVGDTALLRSARKCDARATRALLALGADPSLATPRGMRALDLAVSCDARTLFGTAKEIVDACGARCVDAAENSGPEDGLAPLHRVQTRWASSFFSTRPSPNPWNALTAIMLASGADPAAPSRARAAETALHVAVAKRNVEAVALLLSTDRKEVMLEARDGVGGFTPLAVAFAWRNWAVTLPRSLAAARASGDVDSERDALRMQALDGAPECAAALPAYDEARAGFSLIEAADALARCGFLAAIPVLLLDAGARLDARDDAGFTPLHDAHPALVEAGPVRDALLRAAETQGLDIDALLAESEDHRRRWHRREWPPASRARSLDDDEFVEHVGLVVEDDGLDPEALERHIAKGPVLVLDALRDASWDGARELWEAGALGEARGDALVRAGPIPYASAFALPETLVTLGEALAAGRAESARAVAARAAGEVPKAPTYVFEQVRWASHRDHPLGDLVVSHSGKLSALSENRTVRHNAQFYVGDALSGAPAHFHAHAVNAVVHGAKRWLLFPPSDAAYSKLPAAAWLDPARFEALRANNVSFFTFDQPAGSALYVPAGWAHAVLNLKDGTVGAAFEFHFRGELTWSFEDRATDTVQATRRL
ncbi:hypothetical protein CTAYLR_006513 [Chrysophaeum taylorii]|uniref:JmjC domain-containing protein n=1 Tax=Chrysophaeum taylorii TaxID=2483200 RepID=A0AAD7XMA0_9STRA|nr:hypothetical protein CTAYLR_006513 [Chrysophaeum taylorii]